MNKNQVKSFCAIYSDDEPVTFEAKEDYLITFNDERVLYIDFENDFVTTVQGREHMGEYDVKDWSWFEVFKRV